MKWTRMKNESSRAYHAFCIYRDLGPQRSLEKVREELRKEGKRISKTLIFRWSTKYNWVERATAYDDYLDEIKRAEQEKAIKEMAERHAKIAMAVQQKVIERLKELDVSELSPSDMIRWLDVAIKVERLSRGEPTEVKASSVPKFVEVVLTDKEEKQNED